MSQRSTKYAARHLVKAVHRAIGQYGLINPGERIMVAVSEGADSLSLFNILLSLQRGGALDCRLIAAHVFPGWPPETHPAALRAYFDTLGVPLAIDESLPSDELVRIQGGKHTCYQCARYRRRRLIHMAVEFGCRRIAMAHHREDVLETVMINIFERGRISTMVPSQELFGGQIEIIRPFYAVEERRIKAYARLTGLPLFAYQCPAAHSRRAFWKKHLRMLDRQRPGAIANLFGSLHHIETKFLPSGFSRQREDFHTKELHSTALLHPV